MRSLVIACVSACVISTGTLSQAEPPAPGRLKQRGGGAAARGSIIAFWLSPEA